MSIIQGNAKQGSTRGFYDFPLEQSLRFNDDDTPYLTWTPTSAGNRKTWTFSFWVKRATIGQLHSIFSAFNGSGTTYLGFYNDTLRFLWNGGGANASDTTMVFRDPSAWYHIVVVWDTVSGGQGYKVYVNGESVTVSIPSPATNTETGINDTVAQKISSYVNLYYMDGYLAEVNFIDGTALDASSFGELKNGVWIPKDPSGLTYGTNGFRLSFADDAEVEAFNTVLYRGNGGTQSVTGMGFQPDLVWFKSRSGTQYHALFDAVRGGETALATNDTGAESTNETSNAVTFDSDGMIVKQTASGSVNNSGLDIVAWGWKAGDSNVSNTDGSITSTVRANDTYGFSIVSYTGTGSNATVGHGLSTAPSMVIVKSRTQAYGWYTYHTSLGATKYVTLNTTGAEDTVSSVWNNTAPTTSVFSIGTNAVVNTNTQDYIAYCWAEKAGYSKFGSYTGTGASGNAVTGLGFTPAWLLVRKTDGAGNWRIFDNTRDTDGTITKTLDAENSNAESDASTNEIVFDSDGFTVNGTAGSVNGNTNNFIYAAFADTREAAFWLDQSGNDNDWQPVNLDHNDTVADSPTDNFATLNPLSILGGTFADGNLKATLTDGNEAVAISTFELKSIEKSYAEFILNSTSASNYFVGIIGQGTSTNRCLYNGGTGQKSINGSSSSYGSTWGVGDVIGVTYDNSTGEVEFYKNNVSQGAISFSIESEDAFFCVYDATGAQSSTFTANFGQQPFAYTPPEGYLALSTANLPDPAIDPAQGSSPQDYFNTVTYTGTGTTGGDTLSVTGVGFQPDLVWYKNRTVAVNHYLNDVIRGSGAATHLHSNNTKSEATASTYSTNGGLASFNTDGFTAYRGTDNTYQGSNLNGNAYVAWNWKANGSGVSNTDGSITSTVSANTDAGFSIVSYTGTGATGGTVGHGLGLKPSFIIVKKRSATGGWVCWHQGLTGASEEDRYIYLNSTDSQGTTTDYWGSTGITSSTFGVWTTGGDNNQSGANIIAYCFAEVEGFSKFGSYTGNGSADGPFVYTGFRPAFVLFKKATGATQSWVMMDNQRDQFNVNKGRLFPDLSLNELTSAAILDFTSNGFKVRDSGSTANTSGETYIYMAFAENPFKYSNAR